MTGRPGSSSHTSSDTSSHTWFTRNRPSRLSRSDRPRMSKLDSTLLHLNEAEGFISVTSKLQSEFAHGMAWSSLTLDPPRSSQTANLRQEPLQAGDMAGLGCLGGLALGFHHPSRHLALTQSRFAPCNPLQSVAILKWKSYKSYKVHWNVTLQTLVCISLYVWPQRNLQVRRNGLSPKAPAPECREDRWERHKDLKDHS